jgi:phytoene synthase
MRDRKERMRLNTDLETSYRAARAIARNRARNFYYSFVVLPPERRRALCAVYAFMRHCDDISDGTQPVHRKREMLHQWRLNLDAALEGDYDGTPIFPAFHDAVQRFSIPPQYFYWILQGAEMDLDIPRYATFSDLYRYCFNVASSVGLVCLQIFGFAEPRAKEYAESCGIAFQLTNILRDVKEDAQMGRIYIPLEDLERFHYPPEDLHKGILDERFRRLMAFETDRARSYYQQGRNLIPLIDASSRPALWAMLEIYGRLLSKIERNRYDVFGSSVELSQPEKASIALKALAMRFLAGGTIPR